MFPFDSVKKKKAILICHTHPVHFPALLVTKLSYSRIVNIMVFLTCRYSRHDKRSKLPGWILSHLHDAHLNLSTDMALHIAREVCSITFIFL